MPLQSMLLDLLVLVVLALCAAYYAKRGFVAGVFSFFGTLIALVVAGFAARTLAPAVFNAFFRPGIEERVGEAIAQQGAYSVDELLAAILSFIPEGLRDGIAAQVGGSLDFSAPDIAGLVVDQVVAPIVTPFIVVILFFILFSLVRILVGVIRSLAAGITRLPAINTVNSALGAVVGVFIGALYVYLAFCIIWAFDSLNPTNPIGATYFSNSLSFRLLSNLNFFAEIW